MVEIHLIRDDQFSAVSAMIERSARGESFAKFYPQSKIDSVVQKLDVSGVQERAAWTHFYVIEENAQIVACGAIGPYWESLTESALFNIYVDPDYQGRGLGRKIIETLEADEFAKRATRIELAAALPAIPFYRKMGYKHKNGELVYENGHLKMEKFLPK